MTTRRRHLRLLAGFAASPGGILAQTPPVPSAITVGLLSIGRPLAGSRELPNSAAWQAFKDRLGELGYHGGSNLAFEARYADGDPDRLSAAAAELARLPLTAILVNDASAPAMMRATSTIPLVMTGTSFPVEAGLVASLARPGGNVTGTAWTADDKSTEKILELLRPLKPQLNRVGIQYGIGTPQILISSATNGARSQGLTIGAINQISSARDVENSLSAFAKDRVDAFMDLGGPVGYSLRQQTSVGALARGLIGATGISDYVRAGLLMSYGPTLDGVLRSCADYVDRIARGSKPADLPVSQPTELELAVNVKTARALGLRIPPTYLVRVDVVVE